MSGVTEMRSGLYGLTGMFLGGLLTWLVLAPPVPAGAGGGGGASEELLAAQLRSEKLLERIAQTLPTLDPGSGAAAPVREAVGFGSAESLEARLESLDETLAKLASELARGGGRGGPAVSAPLVMRGAAAPDIDGLVGLTERADIDVDLEHLGWTMQQVLDTYGNPTDNHATNEAVQQRWFYDMPNGSLGFYFIDGRVVKVNK